MISYPKFASLFIALGLSSCGTTSPSVTTAQGSSQSAANSSVDPLTDSQKQWFAFAGSLRDGMKDFTTLADSEIPILYSPELQQKWGRPTYEKAPNGNHLVIYKDPSTPFNTLEIVGTRKPFPTMDTPPRLSRLTYEGGDGPVQTYIPQSYRTVKAAGQNVEWFQHSEGGGADGPLFSTVGFSVTDSQGRRGYYRLIAEGGANDAAVAAKFATVKIK